MRPKYVKHRVKYLIFFVPLQPFYFAVFVQKGSLLFYFHSSIHFLFLFFPQIVPFNFHSRPSCRHFQASSLGLKRKSRNHFLFVKKMANIPTVHLLEGGRVICYASKGPGLFFFPCSWIHQFLFILNNGGSFRFQFSHHNRFTVVNVLYCFPNSNWLCFPSKRKAESPVPSSIIVSQRSRCNRIKC